MTNKYCNALFSHLNKNKWLILISIFFHGKSIILEWFNIYYIYCAMNSLEDFQHDFKRCKIIFIKYCMPRCQWMDGWCCWITSIELNIAEKHDKLICSLCKNVMNQSKLLDRWKVAEYKFNLVCFNWKAILWFIQQLHTENDGFFKNKLNKFNFVDASRWSYWNQMDWINGWNQQQQQIITYLNGYVQFFSLCLWALDATLAMSPFVFRFVKFSFPLTIGKFRIRKFD